MPTNPRNVDELTFGTGASGASWDQFAVNEKLFGVKAGFDEDLYTTKLDRNAPDFKEKERRAQQLANEIMSVSPTRLVPDKDERRLTRFIWNSLFWCVSYFTPVIRP